MSGLYDFEHRRIFKTLKNRDSKSTLLANPDLHDGQVIADEATEILTVIDFGQSVPILQHEVDFGLKILAFLTGVKRESRGLELINAWIKQNAPEQILTSNEYAEIMGTKDMIFMPMIFKTLFWQVDKRFQPMH